MSTPASAEEKEPLLGDEKPLSRGSVPISRLMTVKTGLLKRLGATAPVVDTMTYDVGMLTTWRVFMVRGVKTAWHKKTTWVMMSLLVMVSLIVALFVLLVTTDPGQTKGTKFQEIGLFLRVFVGLLLGFFLTSSTNRWYQSVNGFMQLFDAVRNLEMQFLALGVPEEKRFHCIRYGFISCMLLDKTLTMRVLRDEQDRIHETANMWVELVETSASTNLDLLRMNTRSKITQEEADLLMQAEDPAGLMWYWVASLVGRMAQDGCIPPMASPTYGRIMNLAQDAHGGIRHVKQTVVVQAPFIYVHMLSALVHINNLINAISFGITLGTFLGTIIIYNKQQKNLLPHLNVARVSLKDLSGDLENVIVMTFIGLIGPLLYQSLLDVSIEIAQPFASADCGIPTKRFIAMLDSDLSDAQESLQKPPGWDPPCYKPPEPPGKK